MMFRGASLLGVGSILALAALSACNSPSSPATGAGGTPAAGAPAGCPTLTATQVSSSLGYSVTAVANGSVTGADGTCYNFVNGAGKMVLYISSIGSSSQCSLAVSGVSSSGIYTADGTPAVTGLSEDALYAWNTGSSTVWYLVGYSSNSGTGFIAGTFVDSGNVTQSQMLNLCAAVAAGL
jgi:hypothetical protein